MGSCSSRVLNTDSTELRTADVQKHPSLLSLSLRTNVKFGWHPDLPDHRDHHVSFDAVSAPSHIKRKAEGRKARFGEAR